MEFTKFNKDTDNISKQPDTVIDSSEELKKAFDRGSSDIKEFLNNSLIPELNEHVGKKAEKTDLLLKVDKEDGKGLSSNDYTNDEKIKLSALPTNEELIESLDDKVKILTLEANIPFDTNDIKKLFDDIFTPGTYCIVVKDTTYNPECVILYWLHVTHEDGDRAQFLTSPGGTVELRYNFSQNPDEWSEWEVCNNVYSNKEKRKLEELPTNSQLNDMFRDKIGLIRLSCPADDINIPLEETNLLDDITKPGVYYIEYSMISPYEVICYKLIVTDNDWQIDQMLETNQGCLSRYQEYDAGEWSEWVTIDKLFGESEKDKLSALPTNKELETILNGKISILHFNIDSDTPIYETDLLNEYFKPGLYYIFVTNLYDGMEATDIYRFSVVNYNDDMEWYQYLEHCASGDLTGIIRMRWSTNFGDASSWDEWEIKSNVYSNLEKEKLKKLPTSEEIESHFKTLNNVSNAYKNTVSGTQLEITDISPVEHSIALKIHGKNIFDINGNYTVTNPYGTVQKTDSGFEITTTREGTANSLRLTLPLSWFEIGRTYTVSCNFLCTTILIAYDDETGTHKDFKRISNSNEITFLTISGMTNVRVYFYNSHAVVGEAYTVENIQIEEGTSATNYEAYIKPTNITVTVDGKKYKPDDDGVVKNISSTYPSMKITTDTSGAIITCEYNRDINKAFEELTNAIISLGGNV